MIATTTSDITTVITSAIQGPPGLAIKGEIGNTGIQGIAGVIGASAYEVAVSNGYIGTEVNWLTSLTGLTGSKGDIGLTGAQGIQGIQGLTGATGSQGIKGDTGATGATGSVPARSINIASVNYSILQTDDIILASSAITLTLPDATIYNKPLTIKNIGTGKLNLICQLSQTVDSSSTLQITETNSSVDLISNGFNWFIT